MIVHIRRRAFAPVMLFIFTLALSVSAAPVSIYAQGLPPHLIQTVSDQDIFEGMLSLGYLETSVLDEADCDQAFENVKNCVVRIQMGNAHGSGIIWEMTPEKIVIATNRHVLDYWKEESGYIHFAQGYNVDARVLGVSDEFDVGFLAVDNRQFTYKELQELRYACADMDVYYELQPGETMFLVDSGTESANMQYYEGTVEDPHKYIEDLDDYMLYGYGFAKAGMSGGGTFDARGFLIGMTTAGTLQNETAGVPLPDIIAAYEEIVQDPVDDN